MPFVSSELLTAVFPSFNAALSYTQHVQTSDKCICSSVGIPEFAELIVLQISVIVGVIGSNQVLDLMLAECQVPEGILSVRDGDLASVIPVKLMEQRPQLRRTANNMKNVQHSQAEGRFYL